MRTADYFARRAEATADKAFVSAEAFIEKLAGFYASAADQMERDILAFFGKYAVEGKLDIAAVRKPLTPEELNAFKRLIKRYRKEADGNVDQAWLKQLEDFSVRSRVSRMDMLQMQMRQQFEMLTGVQQVETTQYLAATYDDGYNETIHSVQTGVGVSSSFAKLDTVAVEKALRTNWDGSNYSARIWANRDKLVSELETVIPNMIARGQSVQKTAAILRKRMGVAQFNAERLVRTETAHIVQEATFSGYEASGFIRKYQILATLDKRTSDICQGMDGKIFSMSERQVGVTAPPFHPNCRTTTVVYFGEEAARTRIGRDLENKNTYLSGDTTYKDWAEKFGIKPVVSSKITVADPRGLKGGES